MFCGKCGSMIPDGSAFCPKCGTKTALGSQTSGGSSFSGGGQSGSFFGAFTGAAPGSMYAEPRSTGKTGFLGLIDPWLQMWTHYADAKGRATRKEFWTIWLINFIISLILSFTVIGGSIYGLVTLVPLVCLFMRRCHDFGSDGKLMAILYLGFYAASAILVIIGSVQLLRFGLDVDYMMFAISRGYFPIGALVCILIGSLLSIGCLVVMLVTGLKASEPQDNEYGPYEYGMPQYRN